MSHEGKSYWRSLEQLADDPRAREFLEREFPEGASEPPEGITRRTMLTLLGASLSMAGMAACRRPVEKIVPYVNAPEEMVPGIPVQYATTMPAGHSAYGLVVESHEGRPTKIEGNTMHPSTLGASSSAIQASILGLYDPDRSRSVMHGVESKSWDDFAAAWGELEAGFELDGGQGLAVLAQPGSSPTLARLAAAFRARFPNARWVNWEPLGDENLLAGAEQATGSPLRPIYHYDKANVIVSLDSDFLLTEPESIRHARGFADGRRVASTSDSMNRLYAAESALSLTGGNAEHRVRVPSGMIGRLLANVAGRLASELGLASTPKYRAIETPGGDDWVAAVVQDLAASRGKSLIVAGSRQPAEVHAAALAMNALLGNVGTTLTFHGMPDAERSSRSDFAGLTSAMRDGSVGCLVVLGGNPAYDAPADLDFAGALGQVGTVVHLGEYRDETGNLASWHIPEAHYLESWGDARAADGTASVVQPLIAPLHGGVGRVEMLGLLAGSPATAYDAVRESWGGLLGGFDEKRWQRLLHDGLLPGSDAPAVAAAIDASAMAPLFAAVGQAQAPGAGDLEIGFHLSPAVGDGRYANNGWLQELPDSVSKLTWDNAALISPATAEALGLRNQQLVRLAYEGRELEAAVWIVPGQADHTVALHLGYGRTAAGRIGNGRGFNAYVLQTSASPYFGRGVTVTATGGDYLLAQTQDHGSMEGRPVVRESTLDGFRHDPAFAKEMVEHPPLISLWEDHSYEEGLQWGMSIDLTSCTGCNACVVACQSENNIPIVGKDEVSRGREMHWIRLDRYFNGDTHDPQTVFQPVPCMHCENAPCEQVCPVAATVHDAEGLNTMVYNRCIGTRYCANNCPYKVRRFNFYNLTKDTPEVQKMANNPDVTVRSRGVMEKCSYCTQRINAAKIDAKHEADRRYDAGAPEDMGLTRPELAAKVMQEYERDGQLQSACQQACPTRAITFGNLRDPESAVAKQKQQERDYALIAELNNRPRTTYLAKIRNPHPSLRAAEPAHTEDHH
jgi:molybdopterin-containing oxidoreductase family iron-sulfur binding subunit